MQSKFDSESIKKLVQSVEKWDPQNSPTNELFQYIDISSVDRENKVIQNYQTIYTEEAPSRARQKLKIGDVLVSTVRPNLNAVAIVPEWLDESTASTGYCVLRAKPSLIDQKYLFYWVQSNYFISDMVSQATGASYPAVSDKIVKSSTIPLPPLDEQRRIAAVLEKADHLRRLRRQALTRLDDLVQSVFLEMFLILPLCVDRDICPPERQQSSCFPTNADGRQSR